MPKPCIPGDLTGDGVVNGDDIQPYVNLDLANAIRPPLSESDRERIECAADLDQNGTPHETIDRDLFVAVLLGRLGPTADIRDCNCNGTEDYLELFNGSATDCNGNDILDACDISRGTSQNCNGNFIPDECEPDCNSNGVTDTCDIAWIGFCGDEGEPPCVSSDCNFDTVPDECQLCADCPANPLCRDCNSNGVIDDCEGEQPGGESSAATPGGSAPDTSETPAPPEEGDDDPPLPPEWQAMMTWIESTDFSNMTEEERYSAIESKMAELGIPSAQ